MEDEKLLAAISSMLDEKLDQMLDEKLDQKLDIKLDQMLDAKFEEKLAPIGADITILKEKVLTLTENVDTMQVKIDLLQDDTSGIKAVLSHHTRAIDQLQEGVSRNTEAIDQLQEGVFRNTEAIDQLQEGLSRNTTCIDQLKGRVDNIAVIVENQLIPDIRLLAENYVPAAKRYEKAEDKQVSMENDIKLLKFVVADHSKKLYESAK